MERHARLTLPGLVATRVTGRSVELNILLVVTGSLLLAASAQIAVPVPFSPVPWTMQPLALVLLGAALGSVRGAAAAALYLVEGLVGMPVFAGGASGPIVLFGFTAGYLLAFPAAAWIAGFVSEKGWGRSVVRTAIGMALALALVHAAGWTWLTVLGLTPRQAFLAGVAPFAIADLVKVAIAASVLPLVQKWIERMS